MELNRVAELWWPDGGEGGQVGSGYLIDDRLVLTAAHVVANGSGQVRLLGEAAWIGAQVCWCSEDLALVELVEPRKDSNRLSTRWGLIAGNDRVDVTAIGFPRSQERGLARDTEQMFGLVAPSSGIKYGRMNISVTSSTPRPLHDDSEWKGMSGAAIFARGCLVGVVDADDQKYMSARLQGIGLRDALENSEFAKLVGLSHDTISQIQPMPKGLHPWAAWLERSVLRPVGRPALAAAAFLREPRIEREIFSLVAADLRARTEQRLAFQGGVVFVQGKRQSGKSFVLLELCQHFSSNANIDVYVAYDPMGLEPAASGLDQLPPDGRLKLLIIDDADEQEALPLILASLARDDVTVLASNSRREISDSLAVLVAPELLDEHQLRNRPTEGERKLLRAIYPGISLITKRERQAFRRASIGGAVQWLAPSEDRDGRTAREIAQSLRSHVADAPTLLLLFATSKGLPVPAQVWTKLSGPSIPEWAQPWVREAESGGESWLWISDELPVASAWITLTEGSFPLVDETLIAAAIEKLVRSANPESQTERRFVLRILQRVGTFSRVRVLTSTAEELYSLAVKDSATVFALQWLPMIGAHVDVRALVKRFGRITIESPSTPADLYLLVHYLGEDMAVARLGEMLQISGSWSLEAWSGFLRMLTTRFGQRRRDLAVTTLAVLRGTGADMRKLMEDNYCLAQIGSLVVRHGSAQDRTWWWKKVTAEANDESRPHSRRQVSAGLLPDLTERCIGQERNRVAIWSIREFLAGSRPEGVEWRRLRDAYMRLADFEENQRFADRAIRTILDVGRAGGSVGQRANHLVNALGIARHRRHDVVPELLSLAIESSQSWLRDGVEPRKLIGLQLAVLRCAAQIRLQDDNFNRQSMEWFERTQRSPIAAELFVATLAMLAAQTGAVADAARDSIRRLARANGEGARASLHQVLASFNGPHVVPPQVFYPRAQRNSRVVGELLLNLQLADDKGQLPGELCQLWYRDDGLRGILITELLRRGSWRTAKHLVLKRRGTSSTSLLTRAAVMACAGDPAMAIDDLRFAMHEYDQSMIGAHPAWVRKSSIALLLHGDLDAPEFLAVAAALSTREALPTWSAVFETKFEISFEPRFVEKSAPA